MSSCSRAGSDVLWHTVGFYYLLPCSQRPRSLLAVLMRVGHPPRPTQPVSPDTTTPNSDPGDGIHPSSQPVSRVMGVWQVTCHVQGAWQVTCNVMGPVYRVVCLLMGVVCVM